MLDEKLIESLREIGKVGASMKIRFTDTTDNKAYPIEYDLEHVTITYSNIINADTQKVLAIYDGSDWDVIGHGCYSDVDIFVDIEE